MHSKIEPSLQSKNKKIQGQLGEDLAVKHLINSGYRILARNWRFHPYEIDIIAKLGETVVFVEVKLRENNHLLEVWETVSAAQQKRIISAAHEFMIQNDLENECRFDIIGVSIKGIQTDIEHMEDAFYPN